MAVHELCVNGERWTAGSVEALGELLAARLAQAGGLYVVAYGNRVSSAALARTSGAELVPVVAFVDGCAYGDADYEALSAARWSSLRGRVAAAVG